MGDSFYICIHILLISFIYHLRKPLCRPSEEPLEVLRDIHTHT